MAENRKILLDGIGLGFEAAEQDILAAARRKLRLAGYTPVGLTLTLYRRAIDARRKDDIKLMCAVLVEGEGLPSGDALKALGGREYAEPVLELKRGCERLSAPPLVVGTGPAGMFCGLLLARCGYAPMVIDRGGSVDERVTAVETFTSRHILNSESNIQFGAGGAGTFSDGKLVTRISDARCVFVLRTLAGHGAPADILTRAKPHVGTDVLRHVTQSLLDEIESLGGRMIFNCRLDDIEERADGLIARTTCGDIACGALVIAPGHSARDTYGMLGRRGLVIEPKAFSVGVRIEHLQADIDRALYGAHAGDPRLGPAEYTLSDTTGERGVYTFCMCPGGVVAAASSETGELVVNGMSYHARDGRNANCAVAVSVLPCDYGGTPQAAIEYQRRVEVAAYEAGCGEFRAPVETVGDFLAGRCSHEPSRVRPTYMDGFVRPADLSKVFPDIIVRNLGRGLRSFGRKIRGFDAPDSVLTGAETRTSSPIRILRGESLTSPGHDRIYPCGEGAGYAGGITSAAVDGIRVAQAIMSRFAPRG